MEYKRLGNYIREVNVRNRELKITNLLGLSIEKRFIPSIANTIGHRGSVPLCPKSIYRPLSPKSISQIGRYHSAVSRIFPSFGDTIFSWLQFVTDSFVTLVLGTLVLFLIFFSSGEKWRERYRDYKDFYMYIYY